MPLQPLPPQISVEEYLQQELISDIKHQLIDGEIFATAGASENHNLLALNFASELRNALKGSHCRTFMTEMKLRVANDFFYPDVMVVCGDDDNEYFKNAPVLIIEVFSKSTHRIDQSSKRLRCQSIPTLEEYVLIEQDKGEIQVFSRQEHWQSSYYYLGDQISFKSLGINVTVEDIYYQVNSEDVLAFLAQQKLDLAGGSGQ